MPPLPLRARLEEFRRSYGAKYEATSVVLHLVCSDLELVKEWQVVGLLDVRAQQAYAIVARDPRQQVSETDAAAVCTPPFSYSTRIRRTRSCSPSSRAIRDLPRLRT